MIMHDYKKKTVAHVIVDIGDAMLSLRVFGKVLQDITETAVRKPVLLKAKPFTMLHIMHLATKEEKLQHTVYSEGRILELS